MFQIAVVTEGPMAPAALRVTMLMLAMATRSSRLITAMLYESLVGTSIWLRKARHCQNTIARVAVGAKAAASRKKLEGIWVNTWCSGARSCWLSWPISKEDAVRRWDREKTRASDSTGSPNLV